MQILWKRIAPVDTSIQFFEIGLNIEERVVNDPFQPVLGKPW